MADNTELLSRVPLFADLPRKSLERLSRLAVERSYKAGDKIVEEGDEGVGFFMITSGQVDVTRGDQKLTTLGENDFFGEMALLDGGRRSATVQAATDVKCLALARWDFTAEVETNVALALELLQVLTRRLRELDQRVSEATA